MSHLSLNKLSKAINLIRKYSNVPICIDTEGAQIKFKLKGKNFFKRREFLISNKRKNTKLYPEYVLDNLKKGDILSIGFSNLSVKIIKKNENALCKVISSGFLENNKGVHLVNGKIVQLFNGKRSLRRLKLEKLN